MTNRPIMDEWNKFWQNVRPLGHENLLEKAAMQAAFYAGALVCMEKMMSPPTGGEELTDQDIEHFESVSRDINQFAENAAAGFKGVQS